MRCQTVGGFRAESQHPEILRIVGGWVLLCLANNDSANSAVFSRFETQSAQSIGCGLPP
jgi:hypothetical protein